MTSQERGPLEISLPLRIFDRFDDMVSELHGMTFVDFAHERPAEVYSYVAQFFEQLADRTNAATVNGIKVSEELDGQEAVSGTANQALKRLEFDTDYEPVEVVISVFSKPSFLNRLKGVNPPVKVVSFTSEPPSLAF